VNTAILVRAAELLEQNARELRDSHTLPGDPNDWGGDADALAVYAEEMHIAVELRRIAACLIARGTS